MISDLYFWSKNDVFSSMDASLIIVRVTVWLQTCPHQNVVIFALALRSFRSKLQPTIGGKSMHLTRLAMHLHSIDSHDNRVGKKHSK